MTQFWAQKWALICAHAQWFWVRLCPALTIKSLSGARTRTRSRTQTYWALTKALPKGSWVLEPCPCKPRNSRYRKWKGQPRNSKCRGSKSGPMSGTGTWTLRSCTRFTKQLKIWVRPCLCTLGVCPWVGGNPNTGYRGLLVSSQHGTLRRTEIEKKMPEYDIHIFWLGIP